MEHGSPCNRITWAGSAQKSDYEPIYNCHLSTTQSEGRPGSGGYTCTVRLTTLLKQVPKNDCIGIVVLGDLNEQLGSNVHRCTGKWTAGKKSQNAETIICLMRLCDLFAINTIFQPKKHKSVDTYLRCVEGAANSQRRPTPRQKCVRPIRAKTIRAQ